MRNFNPNIGLQVILWFVLSQYVTSDCLLPYQDFPNGMVNLPEFYIDDANRTVFEDLSILQFTCNPDYELIGPELLQCDDDGWTSNVPFCADKPDNKTGMRCPRPPSVKNTMHVIESGVKAYLMVGSLTVYTCEDGYVLENANASTLRCTLDKISKMAEWEGEMPVCKGYYNCPDPGVSMNGNRSGDCCKDVSVKCEISEDLCKAGDTLIYTCDEGYELVGKWMLRCLRMGIWSSGRPLCRPLVNYCKFPSPIPHGVVKGNMQGDYFLVGDDAQVLCKPGYKCEGNEFVVCEQGGVWSHEFGVCKKIFCDPPSPIEHGEIPELRTTHLTIFPYDFEITYLCDKGYRIHSGDIWRSCGKYGWSGRKPLCEVVRCPDLGIPENGVKMGSNRMVGSSVQFSCFPGFELLGPIEVYCMPNGQWTGEVARCNIPSNYCPDPGAPINGFKNMTEYKMGDRVSFRCQSESILAGSEVRECLPDRTWSGTQTKCLGRYDFDSTDQVSDILKNKMADKRKEQQTYVEAWRSASRIGLSSRSLDLTFPGRIILYFAFDVSRRITQTNFDRSIAFAKAIVSQVGISQAGARAGALTFSSRVDEMFLPLSYDSTQAVLDALDRIEYTRGGSADISVLTLIGKQYMPLVRQWLGDDPKIKSVIFILTDGKTNMGRDTTKEAENLKMEGVEIFCIGITGDIKGKTLYDIASTSKYGEETKKNVFILQDYKEFEEIVQEITNASIVADSVADYSECGLLTAGINGGRIVGGNSSSKPWPWMAALNMTWGKTGVRDLQCGGSIIDRHFVLTAAHCLFDDKGRLRNSEEISVAVGLTDVRNRTYYQSIDVREFHLHRRYRNGGGFFDYDLALLVLDKPIEYNAYVRPICLPPKVLPEDSEFYKPNSVAWTIGFGHEEVLQKFQSPWKLVISGVLKEVALPIQPRNVCLESLRDDRYERRFTVNMFCMGDGGGKQDACVGDSGGPVMQSYLNKDGHITWVQVGVVSWGLGCGLKHEYGFYTHLQRLMPWVESRTET